jgi:hypothetical protein
MYRTELPYIPVQCNTWHGSRSLAQASDTSSVSGIKDDQRDPVNASTNKEIVTRVQC